MNFRSDWVPPFTLTVLLLLLWEVIAAVSPDGILMLPGPVAIVDEFLYLPDIYLPHAWSTIVPLLVGFTLATAVGFLIALVIANTPFLSRAVLPVLRVARAVPFVILAPVLIFPLGLDET